MLIATPSPARADTLVDAGFFASTPAALPTGMSTGVHAGVLRQRNGLSWGARTAWSSATEYTTQFSVRHTDLRLHAVGALQHTAGRGSLSLRLAVGGTTVHETRTRSQGERAGLTGDELRSSVWRLVPSADLELSITLAVVGAWGVGIHGGPSVHFGANNVRAGWVGGVGLTWQP